MENEKNQTNQNGNTNALVYLSNLNLKKIKKLFERLDFETRKSEENTELQEGKGILNKVQTILVIPKTNEGKALIQTVLDCGEDYQNETPHLDYNTCKARGSYDIDWVEKIIAVLKETRENQNELVIYISTKEEYPATFENKHLKIILAPRIETCETC